MEKLDRVLGLTGMSIATSLALEGFTHTGEYSDRTGKVPVNDYNLVLLNVRTIIRNGINAFASKDQLLLSSKLIYEVVVDDIEQFIFTLAEVNIDIDVRPYICLFNKLDKMYPEANLKEPTSNKQKLLHAIEADVIKRLIDTKFKNLIVTESQLSAETNSAILTHMPIDLIWRYNFPKLDLLESHTGLIKDKTKWWTKLATVKKDGPVIPFDIMMLQVFGDGSLFNPAPIGIRRSILEISNKRGWHGLTTISKIKQDIKLSGDKELYEFISKF